MKLRVDLGIIQILSLPGVALVPGFSVSVMCSNAFETVSQLMFSAIRLDRPAQANSSGTYSTHSWGEALNENVSFCAKNYKWILIFRAIIMSGRHITGRAVRNEGTNSRGNWYRAYDDGAYRYKNTDGARYFNDGRDHGFYKSVLIAWTLFCSVNNQTLRTLFYTLRGLSRRWLVSLN